METAKYIDYYNKFLAIESKFRKTGIESIDFSKEDPYTIEFRDVSFRYPGKTDYVLHHFNLIIHNKEKIAIVGENGAGKSTLLKLITGLLFPDRGELKVLGDCPSLRHPSFLSDLFFIPRSQAFGFPPERRRT